MFFASSRIGEVWSAHGQHGLSTSRRPNRYSSVSTTTRYKPTRYDCYCTAARLLTENINIGLDLAPEPRTGRNCGRVTRKEEQDDDDNNGVLRSSRCFSAQRIRCLA